jgi:hypothetical protein
MASVAVPTLHLPPGSKLSPYNKSLPMHYLSGTAFVRCGVTSIRNKLSVWDVIVDALKAK